MSEFLLFRPQPKCDVSCQKMQAAGIVVHGLPLQQISPDPQQIQRFSNEVETLAPKACVIFTSTYAAEYAVQAMQDKTWPAELNYFAIGKSTAAILQKSGLKVRLPKRFDSEGLLEMAELIDVADKTVAIIKGHRGRVELDKTLTERKAKVQTYNLYQRTAIQLDKPIQTWQQSAIRCIIATSGEQVELAFEQFESKWLISLNWITVSQRIVDILTSKGVSNVILSADATDEALITSAKQFLEHQAMTESQEQQKLNQLAQEINQQQNSAPKKSAAAAPKSAATSTAKSTTDSSANRKNSGGGWWAFLTLINFLLLLAVAGGAFWLWQQWTANQQQQETRLQSELQRQQQALTEQQQKLSQSNLDFQNSFQQAQHQQDSELASDLHKLTQQVQANQQHLLEMSGRRPSDWLIAEADYLVRMAGRKLWLEHDVATAILMLQSADTRLADLNDPSVLPVRAKISDDIQTLNLVNNVSTADVALQITALIKQVDALPLAMVKLPEATDASDDRALSESVYDWQTNLAKSWRALVDDFITVRRRTDNIQPLLSDQQQWLVKEQLKQHLLQAQIAVLREQAQLFPSLLELAQQNIQKYFDLNSSQVSQFEQLLQQLTTTDISRNYPQQLQSARPIQDLLQQRVSNVFNNHSTVKNADLTEANSVTGQEDQTP
ncbi:uroporphyrinogen-III C-methyltransferase [Neptunicella sp.]|uniref:uroporphyrinogen-III C-methyltransferase n=1 Tax=Neptunicella sp. TaxID=2125986 RepID=UPI003F6921DA